MLDETVSPYYLDPALILPLAFLSDWLFGRSVGNFIALTSPTDGMIMLIRWLERKLNRRARQQSTLFKRGIIIVILTLCVAVFLALGLKDFLQTLPFGWGVEIIIIATLLQNYRRYQTVVKRAGLMPAGQKFTPDTGPKSDINTPKAHQLARQAIAGLADNLVMTVIAPAFWYMLFGLSGLLFYQTSFLLEETLGRFGQPAQGQQFTAFGKFARQFYRGVIWVPARMAGFILMLASYFCADAKPVEGRKALGLILQQPSGSNYDWPRAAMAGCLGISLAAILCPTKIPPTKDKISLGKDYPTLDDARRASLLYHSASWVSVLLVILAFFL